MGDLVRWYFGFFLVSGFCSILYELVWLRLAMAQFAVTTALVSIVLSAFMIGLGLGSFLAGRYVRKQTHRLPSLRLYALVELLIGVSALAVPRELAFGRAFLERLDAGHPLSLSLYYILAGLWIGITLVPWCACMGATFPFAMAAIRERVSAESPRSFSYLYLANVLGAVAGAAIPLLLIERRGFQGTLHVGAVPESVSCHVRVPVVFASRRNRQPRNCERHVPLANGTSKPLALLRALRHRPDQHGGRGRLDPTVHAQLGDLGLRLRDDPRPLPGRNLSWFTVLSQVETHPTRCDRTFVRPARALSCASAPHL
jgi:MFS family permease